MRFDRIRACRGNERRYRNTESRLRRLHHRRRRFAEQHLDLSDQTGGTVQTSLYGNTAQSTYYPGTTIYTGTYDTTFSIRMFRKGEPGYKNAVPARDILGPHWEQRVKVGAMQTCNASLPN